jgi:hypothetical protein
MSFDRGMLIGWSKTVLIMVGCIVGCYNVCGVASGDSAVGPAQAYNAFTPQWQECYDRCVVASASQWCLQPRGDNCDRIDEHIYNQVKGDCRSYCNAKRD